MSSGYHKYSETWYSVDGIRLEKNTVSLLLLTKIYKYICTLFFRLYLQFDEHTSLTYSSILYAYNETFLHGLEKRNI